MKFKGDIIITDPCYIIRAEHHGTKPLTKDDWSACDYGQNMGALGIHNFLTANTEYGDWSCTTIKEAEGSEELIARLNEMYVKFFSDYNNIKVYKTEEHRKEMLEAHTAEYDKIVEDSGLVLGHFCADAGLVSVFLLEEVLKYNPDFDYHLNKPWTTTLIKDFDGDVEITHRGDGEEPEVSVVGKGNINFYTSQTGF